MPLQHRVDFRHAPLLDVRVQRQAVGEEAEGGGGGVIASNVEENTLGSDDKVCEYWGEKRET